MNETPVNERGGAVLSLCLLGAGGMDYEYEGVCVRVIDGDTVVLRLTKVITQVVDFGFRIKDTLSLTKVIEMSFRLNGINTPEIIGAEKSLGLAARNVLETLITSKTLRVVTHKADKYGRYLVDIFIQGDPEIHVNQWLIENWYAKAWDGRGVKPV